MFFLVSNLRFTPNHTQLKYRCPFNLKTKIAISTLYQQPTTSIRYKWICSNSGPFYTLDHEVGPWKMAFFLVQLHGPTFMVWFLKKMKLQSLWLLTRCKSKCGPRGMIMHQKINVLIFFNYAQKGQVWKKKLKGWPYSCLLLSSSSLPPLNFTIT